MASEKQPLLASPDSIIDEAHEPSLAELQQDVYKAQQRYMKKWSQTTNGKVHRRIMYAVSAMLLLFFGFCFTIIAQEALSDEVPVYGGKVDLEAHIMSKCPDARDCLHDLILPTMQQVGHKVNFKLSFIGKVTNTDDGVSCLHGADECLGNIIELCAAHVYPDPKIYLGFTMCLSRQFADIPQESLVADCALEHGIDMHRINKCATGNDGSLVVDRLQASFNRSAEAGVQKSCTVRLGGEIRCIRDGGEWTDCDGGATAKDLVRDVLELSNRTEVVWW